MKNRYGNSSENISGAGSCDHTEERKWIGDIKAGKKDVFKEMFEAYYHPLVRFAYRYVWSEMIAEGIVQDVFLWIWENREGWKVEGKLKTYLFRAVKYKAVDYWRHERMKDEHLDRLYELQEFKTDPVIPDDLNGDELIKIVQDLIEQLPERPRMIYKLNRLEGLTYKEIADVLEISPKTVETHMSRALDYLRGKLTKYLSLLVVFESIGKMIY